MATRSQVLAFAASHGAKAAGLHFGLPAGTIRSWRSRARRRAARDGIPPPPPTPAERYEAEAKRLAERYLRGVCLGCGGSGTVDLPPVRRGSLLLRRARRIVCPDCGGVPLRIQVNELPRREWAEGMRVAGDAGLGWHADEWACIRAGEVDPDGYRITGRPDA
jgi:transposase-like protein